VEKIDSVTKSEKLFAVSPTERLLGERRDVVDNNARPKRLAGSNKPRVILTLGLVKLMVFKRLEVERSRIIERMIDDRTVFGLGRRPDVSALKVGNLSEASNLDVEHGALG
jgi:hypothetical protein